MSAAEGTLPAHDGTSLCYHCVPADDARAVVIIVHGVGDHQGRYAALEAALHAAGFTVYGFDQRGHGRSGGERTDVQRFGNYVDDLDAIRDFVLTREPGRRLFAFGHSMGSVVVLAHALLHPRHWQGIVVAGCPLRPALAPVRWAQALGTALAAFAPKLRLSSRIDVAGLTHDTAVGDAYRRDPLVTRSVTLRWGVEFLAANEKLLREAARLTMPVLMLHGEADPIAQVEGARLLYGRIGAKDKRLCVYPGLFHELHNELPAGAARVFADILQWLGALHAETRAPQ